MYLVPAAASDTSRFASTDLCVNTARLVDVVFKHVTGSEALSCVGSAWLVSLSRRYWAVIDEPG